MADELKRKSSGLLLFSFCENIAFFVTSKAERVLIGSKALH